MSEAGEPAIVAEGLTKRYRAFIAVDRLSDLSVRRGEVFCLFGPTARARRPFCAC